MKHYSISLLLAAMLGGSFSVAAAEPPSGKGVPAAVASETVNLEAEVVAIDLKSRVVALKLPNGEVVELLASDAVKNLPQVKVGDKVLTQYQQALAMKLKKGSGVRSTSEREGKATSKPGQKPAAVLTQEIDFVADVTDVDTANSVITILGAKGRLVKLKVRDPQVLAEIKKGDQIEGTYVQALAIAVTPSPAAK